MSKLYKITPALLKGWKEAHSVFRFAFSLCSSFRGDVRFSCNFLYFPKYPQQPTCNAYNQKKMRHNRHTGQEGLVTSGFELDGNLAMTLAILVYCIPSGLAFMLETIQRHAIGVQILSLLYIGMYFSF